MKLTPEQITQLPIIDGKTQTTVLAVTSAAVAVSAIDGGILTVAIDNPAFKVNDRLEFDTEGLAKVIGSKPAGKTSGARQGAMEIKQHVF